MIGRDSRDKYALSNLLRQTAGGVIDVTMGIRVVAPSLLSQWRGQRSRRLWCYIRYGQPPWLHTDPNTRFRFRRWLNLSSNGSPRALHHPHWLDLAYPWRRQNFPRPIRCNGAKAVDPLRRWRSRRALPLAIVRPAESLPLSRAVGDHPWRTRRLRADDTRVQQQQSA